MSVRRCEQFWLKLARHSKINLQQVETSFRKQRYLDNLDKPKDADDLDANSASLKWDTISEIGQGCLRKTMLHARQSDFVLGEQAHLDYGTS